MTDFQTNSLYVQENIFWKRRETGLPGQHKGGFESAWILDVRVEEKPIVGYVYADQDYAYFDRDGMVVKKDPEYIEGVSQGRGDRSERSCAVSAAAE